MGFLKKMVQVVTVGAQLFLGFKPLFAQAVPSAGGKLNEITDDLTKVMGVVQSVELVAAVLTDKSLTGADKLKAAAPQVAQVVLQSELMIDHLTGKPAEIGNQVLFIEGCQDLATAVVKILNSRK